LFYSENHWPELLTNAFYSSVRRHLLRLWLRNEELAWKLPQPLEDAWDLLYRSATADEERFALEPEIRSASKGRGGESGKYV
jgi:hypothetical protein